MFSFEYRLPATRYMLRDSEENLGMVDDGSDCKLHRDQLLPDNAVRPQGIGSYTVAILAGGLGLGFAALFTGLSFDFVVLKVFILLVVFYALRLSLYSSSFPILVHMMLYGALLVGACVVLALDIDAEGPADDLPLRTRIKAGSLFFAPTVLSFAVVDLARRSSTLVVCGLAFLEANLLLWVWSFFVIVMTVGVYIPGAEYRGVP